LDRFSHSPSSHIANRKEPRFTLDDSADL
jgi:hypothetical protein